MFDKLFNLFERSGPKSSLTDFNLMAVDLHSHLIPGIDDGVKTMDESIAVLTELKGLGFKKIITTPHVMSDGFNNTSEIIRKGRDKVREAIQRHGVSIEFDAAAEYYLDETMYEKIEKRDLLTMGDNYVLVELSFFAKPANITDLFYKLQIAGYNVILAHPERYPYYYEKNFDSYLSLKSAGVYFQINLMSLAGRYGARARHAAEKMIDDNLVDFVGSDLHGARHLEAIKSCLKEKYLEKILTSGKLLNKTLL